MCGAGSIDTMARRSAFSACGGESDVTSGGGIISSPKQHVVGPDFPVRTVHQLDGLGDIAHDAVEGVIWDRPLPAFVPQALSVIQAEANVSGRATTSPGDVDGHAGHFLQSLGVDQSPASNWLASDITALAFQFAKMFCIDHIGLRMDVICDDACRKFHRDAIKARLICTYSGPGTEYGVVQTGRDPDKVRSVPTGCPILLKGKAWPGSRQGSLFHRSPPISGTDIRRFVAVIDEPM